MVPVAASAEPTVVNPTTRPSVAHLTLAESGTTKVDAVVITANRVPTPAVDLGSSVSIISGQEIEQKQQPLVADVLRGTPGLDIARSGGPNQITSVFMRGANSSHTLVMIDGIEANDPTSPTRAFDFSMLTVDDVDRIEVLRGPQSTLWGSNAMGGVINIITKRGQGPLTGYIWAEGGSFNTFRESAAVSGSSRFVNYSLNVTQVNSQGFSAADAKFGNKEPDGFNNQSLAGRLGFTLSETFDIDIIARYQHSRVDIDNGGGPGQDNPNRLIKSDQQFLRIQPHLILFGGALVQTYGFNYTRYLRDDTVQPSPTHTDGGILKFDFQNDLRVAKNNTLSAGFECQEEGFSGSGSPQRYADSYGIFLQDQMSFNDRLFLTGGVRYEDHNFSGPFFTYRFTGAYLFPTDTKIRASYGTGFKSPSLSDLFSPFGSPNLKPEKNQGWDVGIEQTFFKGALVVDATYFSNSFRDLIDFDFIALKEQNIGHASTEGVELGTAIRPCELLTIGANYTYTDTQDETTHMSLLRRARNKVGAYINYRYCPRGDVTLSGTFVGGRADIDPATFNRTNIGSHTLVNLSTSYRITNYLELTARIDNLLNQHYEEVAGFGTAGFSLYGGLKLTF